jgi:hypothetical protein
VSPQPKTRREAKIRQLIQVANSIIEQNEAIEATGARPRHLQPLDDHLDLTVSQLVEAYITQDWGAVEQVCVWLYLMEMRFKLYAAMHRDFHTTVKAGWPETWWDEGMPPEVRAKASAWVTEVVLGPEQTGGKDEHSND